MTLVGKIVFIRLMDGTGIPSVPVKDEDAWSITIWFQNAPRIIPRSQIKSTLRRRTPLQAAGHVPADA